jgi:hypothetical protein
MEDAEKADLPNSESSDTTTIALHPSRPSLLDLEKVETDRSLSHQPTASTNAFRTQSQALSRTRSLATDGFSVYDAEGDQEEFEDSEDPEVPRCVLTSAWEVRWEKDDPTFSVLLSARCCLDRSRRSECVPIEDLVNHTDSNSSMAVDQSTLGQSPCLSSG